MNHQGKISLNDCTFSCTQYIQNLAPARWRESRQVGRPKAGFLLQICTWMGVVTFTAGARGEAKAQSYAYSNCTIEKIL